MKTQLLIKNFGPITEANIEIRNFLVLIGQQASGKSTIAKLLAIFYDSHFLNPDVKNYLEFFKNHGIHNYFQNDTEIEFICPDYYIVCKTINNEPKVEMVRFYRTISNHKGWTNFTQRFDDYEDLNKKAIEADKRNEPGSYWFSENFDKNYSIISKTKAIDYATQAFEYYKSYPEECRYRLLNELLTRHPQINNDDKKYIEPTSVYIPAERSVVSLLSKAAIAFMNEGFVLPKTVTRFGSLYIQAQNYFAGEKIDIELLDVIFEHQNGEDLIVLKSGKKINLNESASGIQSLIPLYVLIKMFDSRFETHRKSEIIDKVVETVYRTFIIEEPELNLYPKTQQNAAAFFAKMANKDLSNSFIITTHSPYLLSAFNNLLFAYQVNKSNRSETIENNETINPEKFNAFFVGDGTVKQIFNDETGMIRENEFDSIAEQLMDNFDNLMEAYKNATNNT